MRIDYKSHRRWVGITLVLAGLATAVYLRAREGGPTEFTASSRLGLWFGILASACMIFAGLLAALRRVPTWWWIGSRQGWLRGHIWLGLLSGLLTLYHSNFRLGGPLEQGLWLVLGLVLVSGVFGLALQQVIPRMLTLRLPNEVPYEQIPHQCRALRRQADALVDALCGPLTSDGKPSGKGDPKVDAGGRDALRGAYESVIGPFFSPDYSSSSPLAREAQATAFFSSLRTVPGLAEAQAELDQLERFCLDRRSMGEQERLHHWLHGWLLVHIPLSALLLGLGIAHVVTALYY